MTERPRAGLRPEFWLTLASLVGSLLLYFPYRSDMSVIYRFWDAPNYLTVARTLYDVRPDNPLLAIVHVPTYFLAHLPFYPLCVRALSFIGYEPALLLVSVLASVAAVLLFYRLARDVWKLPSPAFLSLVFLFLPPRWFLYRSTGATEALYVALALGSVWFFERARYGRASLLAGLAALTRISGLMFLPAYFVAQWREWRWRSWRWLVLVPAGLFGYFVFCAMRFGNFFAYLTPHEEKLAAFYPFGFLQQLFKWRLYHHVEFHILLFIVYAVGTSRLRTRFPVLFWYCVFQLAMLLFVSTEDWSRYFLVMAPFALIVGYADLIATRGFRWMFPVFAALSVYYAWRVIPLNGVRPDIYEALRAHLGLATGGP